MKLKYLILCLSFITIAFFAGRFTLYKEVERLKIEQIRLNGLLKVSNC